MPKLLTTQSGNFTTAYLIFSALATVTFGLAMGDFSFLYFAVLILIAFIIAASSDKGSTKSNLATIGWSETNISQAIPYGIAGGILAVIIGSLIIKYTPQTSSLLSPDFSGTASIFTGAIIPPLYALGFNLLGQWLIVAPAETAGYRISAPYAILQVTPNLLIAYGLATLLWVASHIPTYIAQGAPQSMYLVLVILAIIEIALIKFTGTVMAAITAHGTFNSTVLLMSAPITTTTLTVVFLLLIVLLYLWYKGEK